MKRHALLIQLYRRLIYTIPLHLGMPPATAEEVLQLFRNAGTPYSALTNGRLTAWLLFDYLLAPSAVAVQGGIPIAPARGLTQARFNTN